MKKGIFIFTAVALIASGFLAWRYISAGNQDVQPIELGEEESVVIEGGSEGILIRYGDEGFSPSILQIKVGDRVTFINESTRQFWPASAVHPTHKAYPGSDIAKCGTEEEGNIFDACKSVAQGQTYAFEFKEAGEWKYHDHLRPQFTGTISVAQ